LAGSAALIGWERLLATVAALSRPTTLTGCVVRVVGVDSPDCYGRAQEHTETQPQVRLTDCRSVRSFFRYGNIDQTRRTVCAGLDQ
jgi:hypothetical protein